MLSPVHNRQLSEEDRTYLLKCLRSAGLDWLDPADIADAEATFIELETKLTGRIAGPISGYIVLFLMIRHLARGGVDAEAHLVEIGTLFGGSAILIWEALQREGASNEILTIDPLDGYYKADDEAGKSNRDLILDLPICEDVVRKNLADFDVPADAVSLHVGHSQDEESIEQASRHPLAALFIDGDHSFEGACRDWKNYASLVVPDGLIFIDNFLDADWPEVTDAVLSLDGIYGECDLLLAHSKLLVLRVRKTPARQPWMNQALRDSLVDYFEVYRARVSAALQDAEWDKASRQKMIDSQSGIIDAIHEELNLGRQVLERIESLGVSREKELEFTTQVARLTQELDSKKSESEELAATVAALHQSQASLEDELTDSRAELSSLREDHAKLLRDKQYYEAELANRYLQIERLTGSKGKRN